MKLIALLFQESTEESTRPSSEAQSSTDEPVLTLPPPPAPPPQQPISIKTEIKTEPVDVDPDPVEHHHLSAYDFPEPIDIKPIIGVPPDFYPGLSAPLVDPLHTEVGI